jgi:hypothetical protein
VIVVVALVLGMPMAVVHVVRVIPVGHGHMTAPFTVLMAVVTVLGVAARLTLVHVSVVEPVQMAVMGVVHMILMRDRDMAAVGTVLVRVIRVGGMRSGHGSLRSGSGSRRGTVHPAPPA